MDVLNRMLNIIIFCLASLPLASCASNFNHDPSTHQFINQMVKNHDFKRKELVALFNHAHVRPDVIRSIKAPNEEKPWYVYRRLYVTQDRIQNGVTFWNQHEHTLAFAEKKYGVPANIIVAIIGVETKYGKSQGKIPVLDSLSTLAFKYPPRSKFFTKELEHYLMLTRDIHWNPSQIHGSYAGAMGQVQFMPSSYRQYAIDFDGKGYSDLMTNPNDAIVSAANYLNMKGWKRDEPIAAPMEENPQLPGKLIELQEQNQKIFWMGFHNFQVITRYNTSNLYAMAVLELSQKISSLREKK